MRAMERNGTSSVFVTDHERHLKGIVTIDDVVELQKKGERDLGPVIIGDVYTTSPGTPISARMNPSAVKYTTYLTTSSVSEWIIRVRDEPIVGV